jgi:DNA-binding response OmpR family regulator
MKVLIVDDDPRTLDALTVGLQLQWQDCEVLTATGGDAGEQAFFDHLPDVVLLEPALADRSGYDLLRAIRRVSDAPVLIVSARGEETDQVKGLELGADDYVTKPFDFEELQARIRAVLRRARRSAVRITIGDAIIDFVAFTATRGGLDLRLSRREFDLLGYLAEREGRIVQRDELLREIWGFPDEPATRAVDYAIRRLRRKLEPDPHNPRHIHTVHGNGYSLTLTQPR